jgi:hypothetical protein
VTTKKIRLIVGIFVAVAFVWLLLYFGVQNSKPFSEAQTWAVSSPEVKAIVGQVHSTSLGVSRFDFKFSGTGSYVLLPLRVSGDKKNEVFFVRVISKGDSWIVDMARASGFSGEIIYTRETTNK